MARLAERAIPQGRKVTYRYEALGDGRRKVKGTMRATSEIAVQNLLAERGYTSFNVEPIPSPFSLEGALPSLFGIKPPQVAAFCRQMATLLEAGVTLLPALQLLSQQRSSNPAMRRILSHITSDLSTGHSLSYALSRHRKVFSELFQRTVEVGERMGRLDEVLRSLADHIEKQAAFSKKVSGAMTYPMIILVVGVVVSFILLTVVLPPLTKLFTQQGLELPLPTRILMGLSKFVSSFAPYLLGGGVVLVVGMVVYFRTPRGRRFKDRLTLNMPVLGSVTLMSELARLGRTMSLMLGAGLNLQSTMEMLPRTTSNSLFRDALEQVGRGLFLGQGLAFPMAAIPLFPPLVLQMVKVGEDSNTLPLTMRVAADFYETAAQERTQAMVSLITPLSTVILAGLVAFIALSVIMPMYSITSGF